VEFVPIPLKNATRAECDQPGQKLQSGAYADALGDKRREQRSEDDRHRQAVPHKVAVVRDEMVISRAECCEQQSDEDAVIRPTLARIKKRGSALPARERDSADPYNRER
jgi:hypothetical protein